MEQGTTKYPAESEVIKWLTSQVPQARLAHRAHMAERVPRACAARLDQRVLWVDQQVRRVVLVRRDPQDTLVGRVSLDQRVQVLARQGPLVPPDRQA